MTGFHQCLVAEIFFWPPGTVTDPIALRGRADDRLAERPASQRGANLPTGVLADDILGLNAMRQHPSVLTKVDEHTLAVEVADVTFIPLPSARHQNLAGLLSVTLPPAVRTGQVFRVGAQQVSGTRNRVLGGVPAHDSSEDRSGDPPRRTRQARRASVRTAHDPGGEPLARGVQALRRRRRRQGPRAGRDPSAIEPSPYGAGPPAAPCEPEKRKPHEPCPEDLWHLKIPWDDCNVEGEIELKLRFRKCCE